MWFCVKFDSSSVLCESLRTGMDLRHTNTILTDLID